VQRRKTNTTFIQLFEPQQGPIYALVREPQSPGDSKVEAPTWEDLFGALARYRRPEDRTHAVEFRGSIPDAARAFVRSFSG
jgi:hypothetical protein